MSAQNFNLTIRSEKNTTSFLKEKRLIQTDSLPCGHYGYIL